MLNVRFSNLKDQIGKVIDASLPASVTFQRGKIVPSAPEATPQISDAVAGLQYLAQIRAAGNGEDEINVVNMASILPPALDTVGVKPNVKDIVALLQYLVNSRDEMFLQH